MANFYVIRIANTKGDSGYIIEKDGETQVAKVMHPDIKKFKQKLFANLYARKLRKKTGIILEVLSNEDLMKYDTDVKTFESLPDIIGGYHFAVTEADGIKQYFHYENGTQEYYSDESNIGACIFDKITANNFIEQMRKLHPMGIFSTEEIKNEVKKELSE